MHKNANRILTGHPGALGVAGRAGIVGHVRVRLCVLGAVCVAAVAATAAGARSAGTLSVRPGSPIVNARTTIEVRTSAATRRLSLRLESPTGVPMRIALSRAGRGVWRTRFRFLDDGTWKLSVRVGGRLETRQVFVKQPPAPIPPFKPWQLATRPKSSLGAALAAGGGIALPLPWP